MQTQLTFYEEDTMFEEGMEKVRRERHDTGNKP